MTDQNYKSEPDLENITKIEIIQGLREYNDRVLQFIKEDDVARTFEVQWTETDKVVTTTAENIIFNFVTHSAYHRGQLAVYLRLTGIDTIIETDFNPYVYIQGQK